MLKQLAYQSISVVSDNTCLASRNGHCLWSGHAAGANSRHDVLASFGNREELFVVIYLTCHILDEEADFFGPLRECFIHVSEEDDVNMRIFVSSSLVVFIVDIEDAVNNPVCIAKRNASD